MYSWIWRKLPLGLPGKLIGSVLLATATVALLWLVVFPWAEPLLPFDDVQVEQPAGEPGGRSGELTDPTGQPAEDEELPYSTETNNAPPSAPNR
ncbi:hypothetical protein [Micromonospora humi]|uniref:Uncharacterized protein n=1 Tax=Micromonospora humi TaxID=745366 RepID=A0A1C5ICZ4_9ACTN|nr:hypothetical protein [Micromonospora humi]SCG56055.1 hypothetical protein GA0070213_105289 [Micromonospora humi]